MDKGKHSIIAVTNIRGFDLDKWMDGLISQKEVFAVEWREGKTAPKGGWPVYQANVKKIAGEFF